MNHNYLSICERISRYDFEWRHLAELMVKAALLGNAVQFAEDSEQNPARVPTIKALREVLDRSMGIHLCLKDAVEIVDSAISIAESHLCKAAQIAGLQAKLNAIYCPVEDDDDLAAESALDAEPVSNSFGVVRYYNDGDTSEIHYLSLQSYGCLWVSNIKEAARLDLLVAKGFLEVYNILTNKIVSEAGNAQYYLVAFT